VAVFQISAGAQKQPGFPGRNIGDTVKEIGSGPAAYEAVTGHKGKAGQYRDRKQDSYNSSYHAGASGISSSGKKGLREMIHEAPECEMAAQKAD
jgi:hypothetical protein